MLKYIKGLWRLWRIRFDIQACENIYYLWGILQLFLPAEGKRIYDSGSERKVAVHPMARRPVVSSLPQFSEALHSRILELRAIYDSKLSTKRIIKPRSEFPPPMPSLLSLEKDSFFRNNEALFLTHPYPIAGVDFWWSGEQSYGIQIWDDIRPGESRRNAVYPQEPGQVSASLGVEPTAQSQNKQTPQRISAKAKTRIVQRLMRGESLEVLATEHGTTAARISKWRDEFLAAGEEAMKNQNGDARE